MKSKHSTLIESFPIVAIGASAGGLESVEAFLKALPPEPGIAFVIIQHLDPTRKGMMSEVIQKFTSLDVISASDQLQIKKNTVYLIPPNKTMSISKRRLYLTTPTESRGMRLPIDFFFTSLAEDLSDESIGIIFSGMGSDGSKGVASIKENSGLVIVQSPESSKFDNMPRSAINSTNPDLVCTPEEMPGHIISYINRRNSIFHSNKMESRDLISLEKIINLISKSTGHDFSQYKRSTLNRRIERRMNLLKVNTLKEYITLLLKNDKEAFILLKEFLIGVTQFFRDPTVWNQLIDKVLPSILSKLDEGYNFRIWVPACSSGEEAYTIAIALKEAQNKMKKYKNLSFQIFATDLDKESIEKGRKGIYPEFISSDIPPSILKKYFILLDAGYQIHSEIREMVTFAEHNLIQDTPFTKLDFISCRNILIYIQSDMQSKILSLFNFCLNPNGILILGISESIGSNNGFYDTVNSKLRIFRKNPNSKLLPNLQLTSFPKKNISNTKSLFNLNQSKDVFHDSVNSYILENYSPSGIVVNELGEILFISGKIGNYLEPSVGKASMNLFCMIKQDIKNDLAVAFRKAKSTNELVAIHNTKINTISNSSLVDIHVIRITKPEYLKGMFMITFENERISSTSNKKVTKPKKKKGSQSSLIDSLEKELQTTKTELEAALQDMQLSREELMSSNEEMQSSNEELQATNEEITTSKEEMQSLNEELLAVNLELQAKVDAYISINNDFKNLLDSTDIATLFLDNKFRVRRFTKQTSKLFRLIESDIGRPFTDIVNLLNYQELSQDVISVLNTLVPIEKTISTSESLYYSVRIMPYRTIEDKIDGIVITFNEITATKELEFQLRESNAALDEKLHEVNVLLEEKEIILKEVHHRIKNNMGTILSIISIQSDDTKNLEVQEILQDVYGRIYSMMVLYDKLYNSPSLEFISIREYIDTLIKEIVSIFPNASSVDVKLNIQDFDFPSKNLPSFGIIINELITNSMKYGFVNKKSGTITVNLSKKDSKVSFEYMDNGPGFNLQKLSNQARGFGLQLVRILVKQIKGELKIDTSQGSKFSFDFEI